MDHVPTLQGRRILVIEDDYGVSQAITLLLEGEGAEVIGPVGWAEEALALIDSQGTTLDAALLDIDLHLCHCRRAGKPGNPLCLRDELRRRSHCAGLSRCPVLPKAVQGRRFGQSPVDDAGMKSEGEGGFAGNKWFTTVVKTFQVPLLGDDI
ncbi:hypothetical protein [Cupriavidus sp. KK10]|jgi:CheY-like chemotaxis protein|uniref:hypothetical protein n=1 Tax=Cupriavidus sp. KK10 TaxID=1478019 RepID=UPI002012286F|nr:hypothetical protein [Cupriavidus sp. KK10]